jgi:DNA-binding SARP family transcriptional activator
MACDALLGRASEALEVFHRCQHALRGYLGVDPGAETLRLYRSLLEGIVADRKGAPARRNAA